MSNQNEAKYARACAEHIQALGGPDLRGLSDAELLQRMGYATDEFAKSARSIAISGHQVGESMRRLSNMIMRDVEQAREGSK